MMEYTKEYAQMRPVGRICCHGPAPIPQEGGYDQVTQIDQISGLSHSVVEMLSCSGMTQSAMMAAEILPGKTLLEALNTVLVCDAINVAMREYFLNMACGRTQTAFSKGGLAVGAAIEDLGAGAKTQVGTGYGRLGKGPRYLEVTEGYVTRVGLDEKERIVGYEYVNIGRLMDAVKSGVDANEALKKAMGSYGRFREAVSTIDPRKE